MKAVIIATGVNENMAPLSEKYPAPMLPLIDRPFIQHVVEYLVEEGVTEFDFILSHLTEKVEALLGDGTRWGSTFKFHLVKNPSYPYKHLKVLKFDNPEEQILLAHADRLPEVNLKETKSELNYPTFFYYKESEEDDRLKWTGWVLLSPDLIKGVSGNMDEKAYESYLLSRVSGEKKVVEVLRQVNAQSYNGLMSSHIKALTKEFPCLMLSCREAEDSIWLSRNITLHPTARLIPPVYIGENSKIGQGVLLGPNAFIGSNSVLDTRSTVKNSIIFPGSYVGQFLELSNVIVDKNRLINFRIGAEFPVADDFILGSLIDSPVRRWLEKTISKLISLILLILLSLLIFATILVLKLTRQGPVFYKKEVVRLPAQPNETTWRSFSLLSFSSGHPGKESGLKSGGLRHFLLHTLPALINIVRGDMGFLGVSPRTKEEIRKLPNDWRELYLRTKAGIITEAYVNYGGNPND